MVSALVGDRDPLPVQAELVPALRAAAAALTPAQLRAPEAPGRWSVAAVLGHLADAELVFGFRLRQVLTREAPPLEPLDQDAWAARGRYAAGDPEEALATRVRKLGPRRLAHILSGVDVVLGRSTA